MSAENQKPRTNGAIVFSRKDNPNTMPPKMNALKVGVVPKPAANSAKMIMQKALLQRSVPKAIVKQIPTTVVENPDTKLSENLIVSITETSVVKSTAKPISAVENSTPVEVVSAKVTAESAPLEPIEVFPLPQHSLKNTRKQEGYQNFNFEILKNFTQKLVSSTQGKQYPNKPKCGEAIRINRFPFFIRSPGDYVLCKNRTYSGLGAAIIVRADGVTIDFLGYAITLTNNSAGIYVEDS